MPFIGADVKAVFEELMFVAGEPFRSIIKRARGHSYSELLFVSKSADPEYRSAVLW